MFLPNPGEGAEFTVVGAGIKKSLWDGGLRLGSRTPDLLVPPINLEAVPRPLALMSSAPLVGGRLSLECQQGFQLEHQDAARQEGGTLMLQALEKPQLQEMW